MFGGFGMSQLSIPARLMLLSAALIVILVATSIYLNRGIKEGADALVAEARYVEVLQTASAAEKSFGDLKYWLTDLAVSLLNLSEQKARDARRQFDAHLTTLEPYDPTAVAAIRREVDGLMTRAFEAVDAYTDDRRVIGNMLMADARVHVTAVDDQLERMVARLRADAARASEAAQLRSAQAVRVSWVIVVAAGLFALGLTILILRSIVLPLRRIGQAMAALTSGRTDIEVSLPGRDELAAMARTLALFRESLVERNRLADEREQALRRLEAARDEVTAANQILQVTFNHMAQGVSMFDGDAKLVAWNQQFRNLLDLPDALLTQATTFADFIRYLAVRGDFGSGDPEDQVRRRLASLGEPYVGARTLPDGRVLEVRRNPVPAGGFVSMYTDITQQRQAQAEIELARNRLSDAIQSISDGFALWDQEDRLIMFNERLGKLLKLENQVAVGVTSETLIRVLAGRRARSSDASDDDDTWISHRLASHRSGVADEDLQLDDDTWLRVGSHRTHEGGIVTTWADISTLKHRELELADLVARLEVARDQATEANRTKSAFLANMSHELRTPLNAIIGYSEILDEEARDKGLQDLLPDIDRIETAGRHLLGVINDILDLSKIEAGRMDIYLEDIDVAALIGEIQSMILPLAAKNGNALEVICPADIGRMRSDVTKVKQSILNLLGNSSKFTTGGRITLVVSRQPTAVGSNISFRVSDTGIGMSAAETTKLFRAFTQVDTTTTKRFGGTGLGLAITKHFCDMLGGSIAVESEPGKGSTFTITLPDRGTVESGVPPEPRVARVADGAGTVLVVDDDPVCLDLLSMTLGREGYRVIHARTGEEALKQARAHHPQAITLDVLMPRMDGWSTLVALKADPILREIPVIMLTVLKDRGLAFSLGASDFMTKPVDRFALTSMLRQYRTNSDDLVLIVEDDSGTRHATRRLLEKLGLRVAEASNGREGLRWLDGHRAPALILLDLMMPVMDGFEFLEELQRRPNLGTVPVVVLTAKQLSQEEITVLTGRTKRIMAKQGTSNDELVAAIRKCVQRHLDEQTIPRPQDQITPGGRQAG
ncbi:PAS-domain containing protein [Dongia deserti]|uniref:PAS-domain containing protein n=1 Tax=Dongia deserti TaxID=2268030 RepID=UPI000E64CDD4|nr:PAS-domain containing protein [Dongia deserti]